MKTASQATVLAMQRYVQDTERLSPYDALHSDFLQDKVEDESRRGGDWNPSNFSQARESIACRTTLHSKDAPALFRDVDIQRQVTKQMVQQYTAEGVARRGGSLIQTFSPRTNAVAGGGL